MNRPSKKELFNKIRDARDAVVHERIEIMEADVIAADAIELDFDVETELKSILEDLLSNITPDDYVGSRPPQRSYESKIAGLEIFAFVSKSSYFDCSVYLKFALTEDAFWLVSLHKNRPKKEEP
ncbi:MAG: hypothetical protein ACOCR8_05405 [Desulfosalsimonas sp.]